MNWQLLFVKGYAYLYGYIKDIFGINLRGLGFAIGLLKDDFVISVNGRKIYFNHLVGGCYSRHFAGHWNEPETHIFFDSIIPQILGEIVFVDVGANVGEFVIDVSKYSNITAIHAFEPIPECADAIRRSCVLNGIRICYVHEALVGSEPGETQFIITRDASNSSLHTSEVVKGSRRVESIVTTIDDVVTPHLETDIVILLIDVEGMELAVIRGALDLVAQKKPLIVFEYNHVSRTHFTIAEIGRELGPDYDIFRLRQDAKLDRDYQQAWNCVAVSRSSQFARAVISRVI